MYKSKSQPIKLSKSQKGIKRREEKRLRKSKDQGDMLFGLYHSTKGDPTREQMAKVADALDLKEVQVYKWVWDTKKRQDMNTMELLESETPLGETKFNIEHKDAKGNFLTPFEVQFGLQTYKESVTKEGFSDELARQVGINIEQTAKDLVDEKSCLGTRQRI